MHIFSETLLIFAAFNSESNKKHKQNSSIWKCKMSYRGIVNSVRATRYKMCKTIFFSDSGQLRFVGDYSYICFLIRIFLKQFLIFTMIGGKL